MKSHLLEVLKKYISFFLIFLVFVHTFGCNYFKINSLQNDQLNSLQNIGEIHKTFILHTAGRPYYLDSLEVNSNNLSGNLSLTDYRYRYEENRRWKYKSYEKDILNEVHFYMQDSIKQYPLGPVLISFSDIKEVRIIEKNSGKTIASYVFTGIGILVGVFIIISIIYALTKSSCPYVYVNDGSSFLFQGEIFGGAISKNLEREDYMPLPYIREIEGSYRIRISNELKERQYTDLAELIVVNHSDNEKIMLDKYGVPRRTKNIIPPIKAMSSSGIDLMNALIDTDNEVYFFNDTENSINSVYLSFLKSPEDHSGKLIINGKNTLWFDYVFGKFLEKFGANYNSWMAEQARIPGAERVQRMLDHNIPLSIYLMVDGKWELVDYFNTIGPLASRDFVIPLDLNRINGDEVKVKVETGFMFWELDYAGVDYSVDNEYDVKVIKPSVAIGTGALDWTSCIRNSDGLYMIQEVPGQVTEVIYKAPIAAEGQVQTVFLHSRGYYELIRDFTGLPDIIGLNKFRTPGYFSEYSKSLYLDLLNSHELIAHSR